MRVTLLVTDLECGGTPLRLARLARGLKAAGIDVQVGCLASQGPIGEQLAADGIPTFACDASSSRDLFTLRRLAQHLRCINPDLIHATLTHANVAARLVGRWLGIPVLSSTATIEVERRLHLRLERWTAGLDSGHIVNSQAVANHVATTFKIPRDRIHLVPPSIESVPERIDRAQARDRLKLPYDAFVVLWIGRFDPVKRLQIAIECVEQLTAIGCHLVLAGDGPARSEIVQRVEVSSARDNIHLLGWLTDLGPAFFAADAFIFPSVTEGMPNAVLQALAFGLPTVASNIPSLRELSGDGDRMLLVEGSSAAAYAFALQRLHDDHAFAAAMSRRAWEWAGTHLDPARTVRRTIAIYSQILERKDKLGLRSG